MYDGANRGGNALCRELRVRVKKQVTGPQNPCPFGEWGYEGGFEARRKRGVLTIPKEAGWEKCADLHCTSNR